MRFARWKQIAAGVACCAVSLIFAGDLLYKSTWRKTDAKIVAVTALCTMTASELELNHRKTSTATVPCDLVPAFLALHADKDWKRSEKFDASLDVTNADGAINRSSLTLFPDPHGAPKVGDTVTVLQSPTTPTIVVPMSSPGIALVVACVAGLIGAALLAIGLAAPGSKRKRLVDSPDEGATSTDTGKVDGMIAEALARPKAANENARPQASRTGFGKRR